MEPFSDHVGAILAQFWGNFRIVQPRRATLHGGPVIQILHDKINETTHVGSICHQNTILFSMKNFNDVANDFEPIFATILNAFFNSIFIKNRPRNQTGDFTEVGVSCGRVLDFGGSVPSRTPEKETHRRTKKGCIF